MTTETSSLDAQSSAPPRAFTRIAVGINGFPEGEDALALGAALADVTSADLMLVAVHPDLLVVLPNGMTWSSLRRAAQDTLGDARARKAPNARTTVESDLSVPRALRRVARRQHRDLLVLGSSPKADEGHVRIGKRTRQLLGQFECAMAIAPRGLHKRPDPPLNRIGVGYDGGPEARAALGLAAALARTAGATLRVISVLDDRLPRIGWTSLGRGAMSEYWAELLTGELGAMRRDLESATQSLVAPSESEVQRGRPADRLLELCDDVDLMVVGSRRWGPVARVVLGSTGEALLHNASCPVVAVPRPSA